MVFATLSQLSRNWTGGADGFLSGIASGKCRPLSPIPLSYQLSFKTGWNTPFVRTRASFFREKRLKNPNNSVERHFQAIRLRTVVVVPFRSLRDGFFPTLFCTSVGQSSSFICNESRSVTLWLICFSCRHTQRRSMLRSGDHSTRSFTVVSSRLPNDLRRTADDGIQNDIRDGL